MFCGYAVSICYLPGHSANLFLCNRTFVNGRNRDVIMQEMRQRIDRGDTDREIEEIIQVCLLDGDLSLTLLSLFLFIASR